MKDKAMLVVISSIVAGKRLRISSSTVVSLRNE